MKDAATVDVRSVHADQVSMLYAGAGYSIVTTLLVAAIFLGVHMAHQAWWGAGLWSFLLVAIMIWRAVVAWRYNRQGARRDSATDWVRRHRYGALITGLVWGWAGVAFFPADAVSYQIFTVLVLSGLVAAALTVHVADFYSYLLYAIPSLSPVMLISMAQGDLLHISMGGLVLVQLLFLLRSGRRLHESITASLLLRYENRSLLADLEREKNRLDVRLARVLDGGGSEVYLFDAGSLRCLLTNTEALENLGYERRAFEQLSVLDIIDGLSREAFDSLVEPLRQGRRRSLAIQGRHRRRDGSTYPVEARLQYAEREEPPVFVMTVLDVTEREAAVRTALEQQALIRSVIASAPIALWALDLQGNFTFVDGSIMGSSRGLPKTHVGDNFFVTYSDFCELIADARRALSGERFVSYFDIGESNYEIHYSPLKDADGRLSGSIGVILDNTERKAYESRLIRQANFDELTGLPNRTYMIPRLKEAFARARRDRKRVALLILDLDNFKMINDTLGHRAGDELLVQVGQRIRTLLRKSDSLFRMSGDEFLVALEGVASVREAEVVARKLNALFTSAFSLNSGEVFVSSSIGICLFPDDGDTPDQLMQAADTAMSWAKAKGPNTYHLFTREMREAAERRLTIESKLHRALEYNELSLVYQPKVAMGSRRVIGAEALLRWHNAELGWIGPDQFIPVAEDAGLITEIGCWVIEQACAEAARWLKLTDREASVAVNISSRQFRIGGLLATVEAALAKSGLPPERLELEMTESLLVQDAPETLDMLHALRESGISLALDDFGTGYSSLSYLKRFPMQVLKIDRSFVQDIGVDRSDEALVEAIIAMAHALELDLVAEGVETEEQLEFMRLRGVDMIQGYYFSPPVGPEQFREMLAGTPPWLSA